MKKSIKLVICLLCLTLNNVSAEDLQQNPAASGKPTPSGSEYESKVPKGIFMAQYQVSDFRSFKHSGIYGFKDLLSVYQKNNDHICVSFGLLANYGLADPDGLFITLGPAYRVDISKTTSLSIPLELMCGIFSYSADDPDGGSSIKTDLGFSGSLNVQLIVMPDKVGFFLGPQLLFNEHAASLGAVAGICF